MVKFRQAQHLEHVMIALMLASAAFSAATDHFTWQAQHLEHVMIFLCGQRSIFSS